MGINPKIIKKIDEKCKNKPAYKEFLLDLLRIEAEDTGHWKTPYIEKINEYMEEGENCED
jgi:hypothetical protein